MSFASLEKKYTLLSSYRSKKFSALSLSQYHLVLCLGLKSLKASCVDPRTQECLLLETYGLTALTPSGQIKALEQLYSNNLSLGDAWASVTVCIVDEYFTLLPQEIINKDNVASYLAFASPKNNGKSKYFTHPTLGLSVAFSIDAVLLRWLEKTYQHIPLRIIHQASSLIEIGLYHMRSTHKNGNARFFTFLSGTHVHISMYHKGQLEYYNQFVYESSDDFLSAVLTVMHTLGIDPKHHEVVLAGSIYKKSPAYKKVKNYLGKIAFYQGPTYLKFGNTIHQRHIIESTDVFGALIC